MTSLHYFALFYTLQTLLKLVIFTFMGYVLTSIDIMYTYISLNLFVPHVLAGCVRSDM